MFISVTFALPFRSFSERWELVIVLCSNLFSLDEYIKQYLLDPDLPLIFKVKIDLRYYITSELILQLQALKEHLKMRSVNKWSKISFLYEEIFT